MRNESTAQQIKPRLDIRITQTHLLAHPHHDARAGGDPVKEKNTAELEDGELRRGLGRGIFRCAGLVRKYPCFRGLQIGEYVIRLAQEGGCYHILWADHGAFVGGENGTGQFAVGEVQKDAR